MTVSRRCGSEKSQKHQNLMPKFEKVPQGNRSCSGGISDRAGRPALAKARAWWTGREGCSRRSLPSPRHGKGVGCEDRRRAARQRVEGDPERVAKARLSGFGLTVELAAGDRGVEARKGIAPGPGDRNAKPRAVRGAGGACRRNQKAQVSPRRCQAGRSPATGGRQRCRPPFCVRMAHGNAGARALRDAHLCIICAYAENPDCHVTHGKHEGHVLK